MVTSSVTCSPRAPAWSGHFTLHSRAVKSRTPDSPFHLRMTSGDASVIISHPGPTRRRGASYHREAVRRHPTRDGGAMATVKSIEYAEASAEVRAVYDDIMATRKTDRVNNFWKALASHPPTLRRTWESIKAVMAPGAL